MALSKPGHTTPITATAVSSGNKVGPLSGSSSRSVGSLSYDVAIYLGENTSGFPGCHTILRCHSGNHRKTYWYHVLSQSSSLTRASFSVVVVMDSAYSRAHMDIQEFMRAGKNFQSSPYGRTVIRNKSTIPQPKSYQYTKRTSAERLWISEDRFSRYD